MRILSHIILAITLLCQFIQTHSLAGESGETISVVTTGVGKDGSAALKNALRAAVEQAVGALVDAETLIENDEVVSDKILSFSAGFVKTYRALGEPRAMDGGLVSVRIAAEVKRNELHEQLQRTGVVKVPFDGKSLFAELATKAISRDDGITMLEKKLDDFHATVLSTSLVSRPQYDMEKRKVLLDILIKVDLDKFSSFVNEFSDIILKIGGKNLPKRDVVMEKIEIQKYSGLFPAIFCNVNIYDRIPRTPLPDERPLLCIADSWPRFSRVGQKSPVNFSLYVIPREIWGMIVPMFAPKNLMFEFLSDDGSILFTQKGMSVKSYTLQPTFMHRDNVLFMFPALILNNDTHARNAGGDWEFSPGTTEHKFTIYLDIPIDYLEKISTVHFSYVP